MGMGCSSKILGLIVLYFLLLELLVWSWSITSLMPTAITGEKKPEEASGPVPSPDHLTPTHLVLKSSAASLALSTWMTSLLFSDLMHRI